MKVILSQDIQGLGKANDTLEVKDGYARNFLIPKGFALFATEKNLKQLSETEKRKSQQLEKEKRQAEDLANKLNNLSVNVTVTTNEEDKLYGSVADIDIASALRQEGFDIDKNKIILTESIKNLGIYDVAIRLHPQVQAKIKVWIVKE